jgi:CubicO group peptidase (beta-lactamase class C family)
MLSIKFGQTTSKVIEGINDWETTTPEEQGMRSKYLNDLKEYIKKEYSDIYSMVIIRNGFLVEEEYFMFTATTKRNIYSCTKSFTSALIGIAIQEGAIESTNKTVLSFFPEKTFSNVDDRKKNMSLYHLLTMTSGLKWNELQVGYNDPTNSLYQMWESNDWIQYVLDQKMVDEPGMIFNYNTGVSHVMSAIINQTTGMSTLEFAKSRLFDPLSIDDYQWPTDANGIHKGGEGLELTPRSLAKLGQLYLDNGSWKEQQIVPEEWVKLSRIDHRPPGDHLYGYGFQWWIHPDRSIFSAWGYAEQRVIVIPKYELVAVFTSYMPNTVGDIASDLVGMFIIPAITSSAAITTNETANITTISFLFTLPAIPIMVTVRKHRRSK